MCFSSYIIDHYDSLPENVLFIHPNRYQWHNDDPDYDGLPMLRRFQLPYLESEGYVNIRCAWMLGCPAEIKPLDEEGEHREAVHAGGDYKQSFQHLFPGKEVPREVGVSCCAQFAATKEKIKERPKSEYERYRQWIMDTELSDSISGRVLEYSWHSMLPLRPCFRIPWRVDEALFQSTESFTIRTFADLIYFLVIFGKPPVHCPSTKECYCKTFGLCNLSCPTERECEGRYTLPPFSTLPKGWPYVGWDHEDRQRAGPEDPKE
jgi:hypothetical protein